MIKKWYKSAGIESIGVLIAAVVLWLFLPGIFNTWAWGLAGLFVGLNWNALKNLTDLDEKFDEKFEELKDEIRKK